MSDDTADQASERLAELRRATADALDRYDLAADGDERGDAHHHPAEAATDADLRERELSEQMRWRRRQEQLEAAERAVREGTYGVCVDCGTAIPEGRLRIRPDAVRCVGCQTRIERGA